jgi:hypothetical protein
MNSRRQFPRPQDLDEGRLRDVASPNNSAAPAVRLSATTS